MKLRRLLMPNNDEELFDIILKAHKKGVKQAIDLSIRTGTPLIEFRKGKVVKIYPKYKYVKVPIKPKKGKTCKKP